MPVLSMFYGIIIRMFNNGEHNPPHFHAYFAEFTALFSTNGDILEGKFPRKQAKLVQAWAAIHEDELNANWELVMSEQPVYKIEPLR